MNPKRRNGPRAIAALLLFSIAQIGLQIGFAEPNRETIATAIPQQLVARLTTRNNQSIMVNGLSANTGASILTGATIETGADQSATVNLGPLGSLDIAQNTKLVLTYDEQRNVKALIIFGCAILTAKKQATGEIATERGSAGMTDPAVGGVLEICFTPGAAAPTVGPGVVAGAGVPATGGGGLFGYGLPATIAIIGGYGATIATPFIFQDNPSRSNP